MAIVVVNIFKILHNGCLMDVSVVQVSLIHEIINCSVRIGHWFF